MLRFIVSLAALLLATPLMADGDELTPVPASAVLGHSYRGDGGPSQIHFINVRGTSVNLFWVGFDGQRRFYATIASGEEWFQPTYVTHRWIVTSTTDDSLVAAFISTRSAIRDQGTTQIALIR